MVEFEKPLGVPVSAEETSACSSGNQPAIPPQIPAKKKRNLPGMPDPDADVIALSPKTLLATNRFVCEICSKGFQRDQNLQLHRRGHNLPWKLKQRTSKEIRKRVYVCPESSCVHHDPSRALGDLTGIKKHFCRKHGEKKWKCERCSKKYAVQSDWKAHMKTCGTREYRCDCGTLFSRRDSFITHRAFCDALAQESAKSQPAAIAISSERTMKAEVILPTPPLPPQPSSPPPPLTPSTGVLSPVLSIQSSELPENPTGVLQQPLPATKSASGSSTSSGGNVSNSSGVFASIFASSSAPAVVSQSSQPPTSYTELLCAMPTAPEPIEPMSLSLSSSLYFSNNASSIFPVSDPTRYKPSSQPALSATALLQKAAQMGATSSNSSSFLRGLGLAMSTSPTDHQDNMSTATQAQWNGGNAKTDSNNAAAAELGLGFPSDNRGSNLTNLMMGGSSSSLFGNKPTTLDLLGLGIGGGGGGASSGGYSAFFNSFGGGLDGSFGGVSSAGENWDDPSDRKPALL